MVNLLKIISINNNYLINTQRWKIFILLGLSRTHTKETKAAQCIRVRFKGTLRQYRST